MRGNKPPCGRDRGESPVAIKCSGLFDLHVHGIGSTDTRTNRPEDILKIASSLKASGVSRMLAAIYAAPMEEMRGNLDAVHAAMEKDGSILGAYLEGPFINPSMCGAQRKDGVSKPSIAASKRLLEGFEDTVKIITVAPEMPGALKLIERCASSGIKVHMGHSVATYKQATEGKKAGASGITHLFNAMRPFHHREPGLAGFGLMDDDIYVEAIADGIHLHPGTLRLIFGIKPGDKILLVSDSIKGHMYKGGVLQGGKKTLPECVDYLISIGVPRQKAVAAASTNPSGYLDPVI